MITLYPLICWECNKRMGWKCENWGCDCHPICDDCSEKLIKKDIEGEG